MNAKVLFTLLGTLLFMSGSMFSQQLALNSGENKKPRLEDERKTSDVNTNNEIKAKWEFSSFAPLSFDGAEYAEVESHDFGKEVACLKYLNDKLYVQKEMPVPGDPTVRTIIKKQDVYNAVRNIEKYYKKQVKNNALSKDEASKRYSQVLKVSISLIYEDDTESFEKAVTKQKKNTENVIALFNQVSLVNIYQ